PGGGVSFVGKGNPQREQREHRGDPRGAIVVEMALGQGSPIWLPFACPHVVDSGDILPFEGLLLVSMVVSG
ncbi:hypothetical protein Tco_0329833, partial [Tanacetum coccineum]